MNRAERRAQAKIVEKQGKLNGSTVQVQQHYGNPEGELRTKLEQAISAMQLGDLDKCAQLCLEVTKVAPNQPDACNTLGLLERTAGKFESAEMYFKAALKGNPSYFRAHYNYANLLKLMDRKEEALEYFKNCIRLNPRHEDALNNIGTTLMDLGKGSEAYKYIREAILLDPNKDNHWINFAYCLVKHNLATFSISVPSLGIEEKVGGEDTEIKALLDKRLKEQSTISLYLANIAFRFMLTTGAIEEAYGKSRTLDTSQFAKFIQNPVTSTALHDSLVITMLEYQLMHNIYLEHILSSIRRSLLWLVMNGDEKTVIRQFATLLQGLVQQCFLNEYVFYVTDEEKKRQDALLDEVSRIKDKTDDEGWCKLLMLACYQPLYSLPNASELATLHPSDTFTSLPLILKRQVEEPLREQEIIPSIKVLGSIRNDVSKSVQEQYESNPYPRWNESIKYFPYKIMDVLRFLFPYHDFSRDTLPDRPSVLIAGCGTGRQAIMAATRYKDIDITSIDLSRTSLAYAIRKTEEAKISCIDFMQADILELEQLNTTFDVIECGGVLHHMQEPVKGWKVLTSILNSRGFMKIGLYSEIARKDVVTMRDLIAEKGYATTPEGIRQCRQDIIQDPHSDLAKGMQKLKDFFGLSECRDLLFHVQEHRFTLPQIKDILEELELDFLGFEHADTTLLSRFHAVYPDDKKAQNLDTWHKFEQNNPATFIGMYQFWVQKRH